jgi:NADPH-dependent curcumin reductase
LEISLTGGLEKCEFLRKHLNLVNVIDYKEKDYFQKMKKACPKGIDSYFDNVGE